MKRYKLLLTTMATLLLGTSASAQITITKTGQTQIGKLKQDMTVNPQSLPVNKGTELGNGIDTPSINVSLIDTAANIVVLGEHANNGGGRIAFGQGSDVYIGEFGKSSTNILSLKGSKGLQFTGKYNAIFAHDGTRTGKFVFSVPVDATAFNTTSDARLKKDVNELGDVFAGLKALNPVTYRMAGYPIPADMLDGTSDGDQEAESPLDDRLRYGFIAQEVREVFPELVSENSYGYLSIDYLGLIPMLVEAFKTMGARIEEQQAVIESLISKADGQQRAPKDASIDVMSTVNASLSQNRPNPFTSSTRVDCTLPEDVVEASLRIYDLQGKQVISLAVEGRGNTYVTVDGAGLPAGMYIYTLIADGKEIDSKRMILTD